jgi:hypothetical protein
VKCCERTHSKICPTDPTNIVVMLAIFIMASLQLYAKDNSWEFEIPWQPEDAFENIINPANYCFQYQHYEQFYSHTDTDENNNKNIDQKGKKVSTKRPLEKKNTKKEKSTKRKKRNDEDAPVEIESPAANTVPLDLPQFNLNAEGENNIRIKASDFDANFANYYLNKMYGIDFITKYDCCFDNCNLENLSNLGLLTHLSVHTGKGYFECPVIDCGKTFKQKGNLRIHLDNIHLKSKIYKCGLKGCAYETTRKHDLKTHTDLSHYHVKRFPCDYCHKPQSTLSARAKHTRKYHPNVKTQPKKKRE